MDYFTDYMNKVKAEKNLKESTKDYVLAGLANGNERTAAPAKTSVRRFAFKRLVAVAAAAVICLSLGAGAYAYYTPVGYVSVDINPSVELGVNTFGKVIKADSYNSDGQKILQNANVKNQSVKDAVSNLVKAASDQGYVAGDGSTVVAVTAESNNQNAAANLQKAGEDGVGDAVKAKNILAVVYANCSDLQLRTQAKELGISPGKYKVISIMQSFDPTIKASDYKDAKMTDLIVKADELLKAYQSGKLTTDQQIAFKGIDTAAEKVKNANGKQNQGEDSQIQSQNQNIGSKSGEKEKEQNQNNGNGNSNNGNGNGQTQNNGNGGNGNGNGNGKSETTPGNSAQAKDNGKGPNKN